MSSPAVPVALWVAGTAFFMRKLLLLCLVGVLAGSMPAAEPPGDPQWKWLEERVRADALDFIAWNQLGQIALRRYRETGDDAWLVRAGGAAEASMKAVGGELNPAGLALRIRCDLAEHRFAAARDGARQLCALQPGRESPLTLLGDALMELGDLPGAAKALAEVEEPTVATLASRARLAWQQGDRAAAAAGFAASLVAAEEEQVPAPLTIAWCHVQVGEFAFRTGDWSKAEASYEAALAALPGWWSAREHLAELRGAQGRVDDALALYEQATASAPRPEVFQSAGDLLLFAKRGDEAKGWHDRAKQGYLRTIDQSRVLYIHHLAGFYSDSQEDAGEAVKFARKDLELRQSSGAWDALAWALYRKGDLSGAREAAGKALGSGLRDSHVLYHAAMIAMSAGEIAEGQRWLRECAQVNPHFAAFHVHR